MFRLPLYGLRVLDLTTGCAGPYATRLLADVGTEVIKIEAARSWDPLRSHADRPSPGERPWNSSPYFNHLNRNKYGLGLDISRPDGRQLFLMLVALSDVVAENLPTETAPHQGLAFKALQQAKADIILASIACHTEAGRSHSDLLAGTAAAGTVALALWHRRHTGRGQHIEVNRPEGLPGVIEEEAITISMPDLLSDPHLRASGFFESVAHPQAGICDVDGTPWRFSETPAHIRLPAPCFGEHNDYVLRHLLGLSQEQIDGLAREGVIADRPDWPAHE
jgi:crotonobetainyl-CoA:carnitine CoA-transferase CaiB-like acyl-CoA transferase